MWKAVQRWMGAVYRPGVYKALMARMWLTTTDKTPNEMVKKKER